MRLIDQQIQLIRDIVRQVAGDACRVRIFGSRLDDVKRGGDVDLYCLTCPMLLIILR